jgi:hypothetical protein
VGDAGEKKENGDGDFRNLVPKNAFIILYHMGMPQGGSLFITIEAKGPVVPHTISIVAIHGKAMGFFLLLYRSR